MAFDASLLTLTPEATWVGYVLDCSICGGSVYYFTSSLNQVGGSVVWQGITYQPMPIVGSGFESTTQGALPHPKLQVANLDGLVGALVASLGDLVGAVVTRKQVAVKFLDAVNFPGGVNTSANPAEGYDDSWTIEQKESEVAESITFDLVASCDAQGLQLPARVVQVTNCPWAYKNTDGSGLCTYTGPLATCDHGLKTPNGCVKHFCPSVTTGSISLACNGTAKTWTRSTGSFLDDGFAVGYSFASAGFTTNGNNNTFVITAVSDLVITTAAATGMVTESAGMGKSLTVVGVPLPFGGFPGALQVSK